MGILDAISVCAIKFAIMINHDSKAKPEVMYDVLARFAFLWKIFVNIIRILGIDEIILAPSKSKVVPVPLILTYSEKFVKDVFKPKEGEIVVDVGTFIGRFTLLASKRIGRSGKVVGIEPDSELFRIVKQNVLSTGSTNVTLLNAAASNREGVTKMYGGNGRASLLPVSNKFFSVSCITIDAALEKLGIEKVDWMKIDVEGAGLLVLEGSIGVLKRSENLKLIIEIHRYSNETKVINWLEKYGYQIKHLKKLNGVYHVMVTRKKGRAFKSS